jgi:UDP-2-acetamido-2-deoxy-ribo-hexuluronate aminotransferase
VHYPVALHRQPAYAALFEGEAYPVSEQLGRGVLSLPMHPYLDDATQNRIAQAVRAGVGKPTR